MKSWALWALLAVVAPEVGEEAYSPARADADVEVVVTDSSKAYLRARARLETHPDVAAPALRARLDAVPAPGPSEQRRLLSVLASLSMPEDLPRLAAALRRAVVGAAPGLDPLEVAHPWRMLLLDQRERAIPQLEALAGDSGLPVPLRARLLDDWIGLAPPSQLTALVSLVGRGQPALERELRRGLAERAARDPQVRASMIEAADTALDAALASDGAETKSLPALLRFRARIGGDEDTIATRLVDVATDDGNGFGTRVAALRALALVGPTEDARLGTFTQTQLDAAHDGSQRGEILGWLAIGSMTERDAADLSETYALRTSGAPRLAAIGFALAPTDDAHNWLPIAARNPWPQVRQAAFERVQAPCHDDTVALLAERGSADDGADPDRAAARAAIAGLGRCASRRSTKSLRRILVDANGDIELRAEAARQLARLGDIDPVLDRLRARPEAALARRLAAALRHAPASTETMDEILCAYVEETGPVARAAADTLQAHHEGDPNPCD